MSGIIFFGMQAVFSLRPLQALLEAGADVMAVVIPADHPTEPLPRRVELPPLASSDLPVINPYLNPTIVHLAWAHHIPVWQVGSLTYPPILTLLTDLQPDLIVVACFPYIFPPALLQLPPHGCLNLHPSLLPAYRGPAPLYWQAHFGERRTGLTLHFLDTGLDTGDIVWQVAFDWPEGRTLAEIEQRCAWEGARLLTEAVRRLAQGEALPRRPQPQQGSSYFSFPAPPDDH
jgi:methionyl-tRNA formyltransferase